MHPAYFDTRFRLDHPVAEWPETFIVLTAYAPTGQRWTDEENARADRELERALRERSPWVVRMTGYAPDTGHAEPGWGCTLGFDEACDLGNDFQQDALYLVEADTLFVSYCDARRAPVRVGPFRERVDGIR